VDIALNIVGALFSLTFIGLIVTNPRLINKTYHGISDGLNSWFEKAFASTSERFEPEAIEPEPEPIDYKALEKANHQSMVDSWDEQFLRLHKLGDLTDEQLERLADFDSPDKPELLKEVKKRIYERTPQELRSLMWGQGIWNNQSKLDAVKSAMFDVVIHRDDAYISSRCARGYHENKCKDHDCDCECHVDSI